MLYLSLLKPLEHFQNRKLFQQETTKSSIKQNIRQTESPFPLKIFKRFFNLRISKKQGIQSSFGPLFLGCSLVEGLENSVSLELLISKKIEGIWSISINEEEDKTVKPKQALEPFLSIQF